MTKLIPFEELNRQVNGSFFDDEWFKQMNAEVVRAYWKLEPTFTFVARHHDVNWDYGFKWRPDRVAEVLEVLVRGAGYKVESSDIGNSYVSVTVSLTGKVPF